jgi:2-iminobutanoate/2-iminopropanoate deaminase
LWYKKEAISSRNVANSNSPLSQGIKYGNIIFLSGQLGKNPDTGKLEEGFNSQVRRVLQNLKELLSISNSSMDKVLKVTIFVTDINKVKELNPIYKEYFNEPFPSRICVEVSALAQGAEVEMDVISSCN